MDNVAIKIIYDCINVYFHFSWTTKLYSKVASALDILIQKKMKIPVLYNLAGICLSSSIYISQISNDIEHF